MSTEEQEIPSGNDDNLVQNSNVITQVEASPVRNLRNENSQNASVEVAVNEMIDQYKFRTESPHEEDDNREQSNESTELKLYQDEEETNVDERKKNTVGEECLEQSGEENDFQIDQDPEAISVLNEFIKSHQRNKAKPGKQEMGGDGGDDDDDGSDGEPDSEDEDEENEERNDSDGNEDNSMGKTNFVEGRDNSAFHGIQFKSSSDDESSDYNLDNSNDIGGNCWLPASTRKKKEKEHTQKKKTSTTKKTVPKKKKTQKINSNDHSGQHIDLATQKKPPENIVPAQVSENIVPPRKKTSRNNKSVNFSDDEICTIFQVFPPISVRKVGANENYDNFLLKFLTSTKRQFFTKTTLDHIMENMKSGKKKDKTVQLKWYWDLYESSQYLLSQKPASRSYKNAQKVYSNLEQATTIENERISKQIVVAENVTNNLDNQGSIDDTSLDNDTFNNLDEQSSERLNRGFGGISKVFHNTCYSRSITKLSKIKEYSLKEESSGESIACGTWIKLYGGTQKLITTEWNSNQVLNTQEFRQEVNFVPSIDYKVNFFPKNQCDCPKRVYNTGNVDKTPFEDLKYNLVHNLELSRDGQLCNKHSELGSCGKYLTPGDVLFLDGTDCHLVGGMIWYVGAYKVIKGEPTCKVGVCKGLFNELELITNRVAQVCSILKKRDNHDDVQDKVHGSAEIIFIDCGNMKIAKADKSRKENERIYSISKKRKSASK